MKPKTTACPTAPTTRPPVCADGIERATETEATRAQLQALQALTDTALSHLALDDLLRELLGRVTAVMGVDNVTIFLLDEDGQTLTVWAARGLLAEYVGRGQVPVGRGISGRIAASREPLIVDDTSAFDVFVPGFREQQRSLAGVPLLVEDPVEGHLASRLVGVIHVGSVTLRRFTAADVQLLQRAADRIALAVDRARLYAAEQAARRRAEAALARAQATEAQATERAERLNTILETMAEGVVVYDAAGRPLQMNRAYRELYAAERAPVGYESLPASERMRLLAMRDASTGAPLPFAGTPTGRALRGETANRLSAEYRARAFDGRELEVHSSAAPLRDREPDGRIVGAVLVVRDVTARNRLAREREAARAQAERQADQLDCIFEAAADGLIVYDAEGQMVRANVAARRILGLDAAPPGFYQLPLLERLARYAAHDEQGRPIPAEELPFVRVVLRGEVGTGSKVETWDVRMRALDGREIEITMNSAPLRDREGHLVGAVNVVHDQTERNRLAREREVARADELATREVNRRLEEFLATAAHDLRTPLSTTIGYLDLAERASERLAAATHEAYPDLAPRVEAVRDRLEDADQSAARLVRLLTLLFDTAAIRTGKLELHRAPCDLAALVRQQVAALRVAAPGRTIRLHTPAAGGLIPVAADADRIGQVVVNYVTNALKYAPPDRPVDVSVAARGSRARVAVRDRGPGIPAAERARVWELFHRAPGVAVQGGTKGGTKGSLGLGLHICRAIITTHGGRVGVKSTVDEGSTFWFTLPLSGLMPGRDGVAP